MRIIHDDFGARFRNIARRNSDNNARYQTSLQIDTLRGVACILLVLLHAVLEVQVRHPQALTELTTVNDFLAFLRMPLFTFLSGYVCSIRPVDRSTRGNFVKRKTERILVPLIFLTMLTVTLHAIAGSGLIRLVLVDIINEIMTPSFHLWFLEAIGIIFILVALGLGSLFRSATGCVVVLLAVAIADAFGITEVKLFSIGKAIDLIPYYMAGAITQSWSRNRIINSKDRWLAVVAIILVITLRILQIDGFQVPSHWISLAALFCLVIAMPVIPILSALGRYSMTIFLYHALILAALARHLPGPPSALIMQLIALCLAIPVLLHVATERWLPRLLPLLGGPLRQKSKGSYPVPGSLPRSPAEPELLALNV